MKSDIRNCPVCNRHKKNSFYKNYIICDGRNAKSIVDHYFNAEITSTHIISSVLLINEYKIHLLMSQLYLN